jgi:aminopeptidase N
MKYRKFILVTLYSLFIFNCFADNYPRNYSIDIIHYAFELKLSDNTDEIFGKATIQILSKTNDIRQIRLDLVNKTTERSDKGMVVESVMYNNIKVAFTHQHDALFIQLGSPAEKDKMSTVIIQYRGVPADGLRIGPTKYGDRSFFNENWPNRVSL